MTKQRVALAPIRKTITVQATPQHAFEVFTGGMNSWWPADYTPFPREAIVIEPRVGGRWYESGSEGSETTNGKVMQWDPPGRLLLAWQLDGGWKFDPKLVTEVEIRFVGDGNGGTRVDLEHRRIERMGNAAEATDAMLDEGWETLLRRYASSVSA
jgi:uncharacterized protein YndB with AHSA1/START domain